ncbi:MAG: thiopurine S-methyltransferase [Candidatus Thiodiazotropha sp. (ex Codakia rugifera)]|nr:thiopurine S-methyltransferase [Candidatus Thiodiazotropha sp. (ex Codakia rugifera)]
MCSTDSLLSDPNPNWLQRWKDNNIGWHHVEFNPHLLNYWHALYLPQGSLVLAPLCGKSRDMVWLAEQGYRIRGVELSQLAVNAFFKELALQPLIEPIGHFERWSGGPFEILCGDIFHLDDLDNSDVDAVYDRASLVALNPHQRASYAQLLINTLPKQTKILLITMEYPQQEMSGPPFSVHESEVLALFENRFSIRKLHTLNILQDTERYHDKGVSHITEQIYLLK